MRFSHNTLVDCEILRKTDPVCADYGLFLIVENSETFSLLPYATKITTDIIKKYFPNREIKTIIDTTAHIGCDSVNFYLRFNATVICLENDELTYNQLEKNLETFNNGNTSLHAVFCNCLSYMEYNAQPVDFVYIDPPWGSFFKRTRPVMLYLKNKDQKVWLYDFVYNIFKKKITKIIVIKVPPNFNFGLFKEKTEYICTYQTHKILKPKKYNKPRIISYYLMVCKYKHIKPDRFENLKHHIMPKPIRK